MAHPISKENCRLERFQLNGKVGPRTQFFYSSFLSITYLYVLLLVIAETKFVVSSFVVLATIDTMFSPLCYASGSSSTDGSKDSHEP
jgi:hypothetical protein